MEFKEGDLVYVLNKADGKDYQGLARVLDADATITGPNELFAEILERKPCGRAPSIPYMCGEEISFPKRRIVRLKGAE